MGTRCGRQSAGTRNACHRPGRANHVGELESFAGHGFHGIAEERVYMSDFYTSQPTWDRRARHALPRRTQGYRSGGRHGQGKSYLWRLARR